MHHAINEYQLRLDVQRFLRPVYYISYIIYADPLSCILGCNLGCNYEFTGLPASCSDVYSLGWDHMNIPRMKHAVASDCQVIK